MLSTVLALMHLGVVKACIHILVCLAQRSCWESGMRLFAGGHESRVGFPRSQLFNCSMYCVMFGAFTSFCRSDQLMEYIFCTLAFRCQSSLKTFEIVARILGILGCSMCTCSRRWLVLCSRVPGADLFYAMHDWTHMIYVCKQE